MKNKESNRDSYATDLDVINISVNDYYSLSIDLLVRWQ